MLQKDSSYDNNKIPMMIVYISCILLDVFFIFIFFFFQRPNQFPEVLL